MAGYFSIVIFLETLMLPVPPLFGFGEQQTYGRHSGAITCRFPHANSSSVCRRGRVHLVDASEEPIYNLERLLCIPLEGCLVWAAPIVSLAPSAPIS